VAPAQGGALRLLDEVRAAQTRALWLRGGLLGAATLALGVAVTAAVGLHAPRVGQALLAGFSVLSLAVVLLHGVWLQRRRVGDAARTATLLAPLLPDVKLDLLAAVELSKALGQPQDFSSDLARAFIRDVDARAAQVDVSQLVDAWPVRRSAGVLVALLAVTAGLFASQRLQLGAGLLAALTAAPPEPGALKREPITGDVSLAYHYPAYTGLEARTLEGSTGEVLGPAGTEVVFKTRADRDVSTAELVVNGAHVPLQVHGRELEGRFVLEQSGQYHVAFLDGTRAVAEGPDLAVQVELDQAPQVRLTEPVDGLELDPKERKVTLTYEASDDYGLSALELVYRLPGGKDVRLNLKPDDGRSTRGHFAWDLSALELKPGQVISYFVEAKDNDTVHGAKAGASRTQTLKLYSAAEHRQEALRKAEALWEKLVTHLADRLESPERPKPTAEGSPQVEAIDERADALGQELSLFLSQALADKDPPYELLSAAVNVEGELRRDTMNVRSLRRYLRRVSEDLRAGGSSGPLLAPTLNRLGSMLAADIEHSQKNVLYLEALLDRQKLEAIKELAEQLRSDRRELSRLLEEFRDTKDDQVQQALLGQMESLRQRMQELQKRMTELAHGIHDDFMNREALEQMMQEQDMGSALDDMEKLVREGKTDEAMKKMQELSMEMDEFLESLENAAEQADEQADPELARQFEAFSQQLDETLKSQQQVADQTRALRDKYREQSRQRILKEGRALKASLEEKLQRLQKSYESLDARFGDRIDEERRRALQSLENVRQSLKSDDFDLAAETADKLEQSASMLEQEASAQQRNDERFANPPQTRAQSKQLHEQLSADEAQAREVAEKLHGLFPQAGQQMSDADKQQLGELTQKQGGLEKQGQQLQKQMEQLGEKAPIFDEEAMQQMEQAAQKMGEAGRQLKGRDTGKGYGEQQGALQALQGIAQQMQQGQRKGGKGGMPLPMRKQGKSGSSASNEKVEIPDDDPTRAPRELRKDVMDAMKQGAPDRYRDQNKHYYEELVK
jgi:hypothetical protein